MTAVSDAPDDEVAGASPSPWAGTTAGFGMIVFLASDVMLFASFFASWFLLRATNAPWPPDDVELDLPRAALATGVLVASSVTFVTAERCYERSDLAGLRRWILLTLGLGGLFLVNQLVEYQGLPFRVSSHVYGSMYWLLTGLHTVHVAVGLGALGMLLVRAARVRHDAAIAPWVAAIGAYWHLVDVVWILLLTTIWIVR